MKDKHGKKLEKGDTVTLTATVTDVGPSGDYANVTLESVHGRTGDDVSVMIPTIDASVLEKVAPHPKAPKKAHKGQPFDARDERDT